ncbi:glycosyltransferase family 2 protein [Thermodesulfobacteriota bacterium]
MTALSQQSLSISIVMPLYNKGSVVRRAIESVLKQTVSEFELIVVNDGSTDKSPEVARSIDDPRIKIIDQENAGVSAARNRGITEAKSDLIAFLDADDEWKPSFLEAIFNLINKFPTCKVFATNYIYREVNGASKLPIIRGLPPHPWEGILEDYFEVASKSDPPLWTSAVSVKKKAIQSINMFPVGVTSGEDLLTWARLSIHNDIAYSSKPEAIFWLGTTRVGVPARIPDKDDIVGQSLLKILHDLEPQCQMALKKYIALWHRMRAAQYLQANLRSDAFRELSEIAHFEKMNPRLFLYFAIASLPTLISKKLFVGLNLLKTFRRRLFV